MNIFIREDSGQPIYEQIVQAIKTALLEGSLQPEETLPSIRTLAKDLGISVITTKRAYEVLESEGLIYSQQGKGFYVKESDREALREEQLRLLELQMATCIREGSDDSDDSL